MSSSKAEAPLNM
jgi:hypothetical protein